MLTAEYPYLFAVLVGLVPVAAAFAVFRRERRMMLVSGLILAAASPFNLFFEPGYWRPDRWGGWALGIEDPLMNFSIGSLAWLAAALPLRARLMATPAAKPFALRLLVIFVGVSLALNGLQFAGLTIMTAAFVVQLGFIAVGVGLFPSLWRIPANAALLYPPYYVAVLFLASAFSDGFFQRIWNGPELWPLRLHGLPVQELLWAYSFPPAHAFAMAIAARVRIVASSGPVLSR